MKTKKIPQKLKAFTLIEVIIVLAIAALIMVIVFSAVGGAQRGRRDQQRKTILSTISAQLENYSSNNGGDYPADITALEGDFATTYLKDTTGEWREEYQDPDSGIVDIGGLSEPSSVACSPTDAGKIYYAITGRRYRLTMCLEQGKLTLPNNSDSDA